MSAKAVKRRHRVAHLGDWPGDAMTWRVIVTSDTIVAREVGNPGREVSQGVAEWLAEKAGFTGRTVDAFKTPPPLRCDHKFIDSKACVKCGWNPDGGAS